MSERSYLSSQGLADQLVGLNNGYNPYYEGDTSQNLLTLRSTGGVNPEPGFLSGLGGVLSNSDLMSGITGLGSTLAQFAALPSQIDWAKTNTKALKQNIATAREEQARRNKNITGFNSINTNKYI